MTGNCGTCGGVLGSAGCSNCQFREYQDRVLREYQEQALKLLTSNNQFREDSYVPQTIAAECLARLDASGFGKPQGHRVRREYRGNTLWAMVMDACDEVDQLRTEIAAYQGTTGLPGWLPSGGGWIRDLGESPDSNHEPKAHRRLVVQKYGWRWEWRPIDRPEYSPSRYRIGWEDMPLAAMQAVEAEAKTLGWL